MASDVKFVWFPGWSEVLMHEPRAVAVLVAAAKTTADLIDGKVPVVTGSYKAHFDMGLDVRPVAAEAHIEIGEPRWHIIEHGSVKNDAYAPIRKGVDASGLRWEPR